MCVKQNKTTKFSKKQANSLVCVLSEHALQVYFHSRDARLPIWLYIKTQPSCPLEEKTKPLLIFGRKFY